MKSFLLSTRSIAFRNLTDSLCRLSALLLVLPAFASAEDLSAPVGAQGGASVLWIFANLSFTGMWAQAKGATLWKVIAFILGFPGTLLTLIIVKAGSERAYGIDLPRKP